MVPARWMLGRWATAGYALVAAAVLATGIAGYSQLREAQHAGDVVRLTQQTLQEFAGLEATLLSAETGQRGYLLTGDEAYLAPYYEGAASMHGIFERLARLTAERPLQQARLREIYSLTTTKMDELRETIEQRRTRGLDAAMDVVRSNVGQHAMDTIRELVSAALAQEEADLTANLAARAVRFRRANRIILGGSALALIVVVLSTSATNRSARRRRLAERRLMESQERLRVTLRSIGDAVIATDVDGRVVFMNAVAETLTGWSAAEGQGRRLDEVFHVINEETRAAVESPVDKVLREGAIVGLANHTVLMSRHGAEVPVEDSGAPIRDASGQIMGVVLVFRDVTERKLFERGREQFVHEEAARRAAEAASQAKDEFLAVISHELRSPLQGILGWLGVLRAGQAASDRAPGTDHERALQAIQNGVYQQTQLVNDLLEASRIVAGKLEIERSRVDLGRIVKQCVEEVVPMARDKGVEIAVAVEHCGTVLGDPHRLHQSIANVVANAVKFTPTGGHVDIRCHREDDEVVVTVRDSGVGIAPEFLPRLFERFSQALGSRERGTIGLGLGLSIARQIVELHGGSIVPQSDGPGCGATFTIRLPLASGETYDLAEGANHAERARLEDVSLLVVDDDENTRESLALLLSLRGAAVRSAASVAQALEAYSRERAQVLVSDVSMPERDGYELIRLLRNGGGGPGPIAIALTGFAAEGDRTRATRAGFDAHVAKPVDIDVLVATIRALVDAR